MFSAEYVKRFEEKFEKTDGCWVWKASVAGKGYGQVKLPNARKQIYAHRLSYLIYKGEIPDGVLVMHSCDNPKCVNPEHLSLGTSKMNMRDMVDKGRSTYGARNARAKLSFAQVDEIHSMLKQGYTQVEIAAKFNVTQVHISRIHRGSRWGQYKVNEV